MEPQKAILCVFSCQLFLHPQGPRAGLASASCTHLIHTPRGWAVSSCAVSTWLYLKLTWEITDAWASVLSQSHLTEWGPRIHHWQSHQNYLTLSKVWITKRLLGSVHSGPAGHNSVLQPHLGFRILISSFQLEEVSNSDSSPSQAFQTCFGQHRTIRWGGFCQYISDIALPIWLHIHMDLFQCPNPGGEKQQGRTRVPCSPHTLCVGRLRPLQKQNSLSQYVLASPTSDFRWLTT